MFRRLLRRLSPLTAPYAVRFKRFVVLSVPGGELFVLSHEQAKTLAEQLSPTTPQR